MRFSTEIAGNTGLNTNTGGLDSLYKPELPQPGTTTAATTATANRKYLKSPMFSSSVIKRLFGYDPFPRTQAPVSQPPSRSHDSLTAVVNDKTVFNTPSYSSYPTADRKTWGLSELLRMRGV